MNNANRRQEEDMTMDEILASIRRYVSGDGQETVVMDDHQQQKSVETPASTSPYVHLEPDATPHAYAAKSPDVVRLTSAFEVPREKQNIPYADRQAYEPLRPQETKSEYPQPAGNPFDKLSEAVRKTSAPSQEPPISTGTGLNLDQVFRKMTQDMIQQWLDKNMPGIVENLVQKEIQRLTGRS
jgi:uncharacterized protein